MSDDPAVEVRAETPSPVLALSGDWLLDRPWPLPEEALACLVEGSTPIFVSFDSTRLGRWDSTLLVYVRRLEELAGTRRIELDLSGLPAGARRLMELAQAGVPATDGSGAGRPPGAIARLGLAAGGWLAAFQDALRFVGEVTMAAAALATGRARFPLRDLALAIETTGARALPIIALIAVLVGMILAFIGALQLAQFGAEVYVANLVAVGMLREMGAMMAAIVMAGRTGAAFAAEIGAMRVNEEIDALVATGLSPQEFLVLPRVGGLLLMLPLLTVYADILGILGGALIGIGLLDIRPALYLDQTLLHLSIRDFGAGVLKAYAFAIVVSLAGCYHGLRCGRSSAAVGVAATRAVVAGIVGVIVTDALFTLVYHVLGI